MFNATDSGAGILIIDEDDSISWTDPETAPDGSRYGDSSSTQYFGHILVDTRNPRVSVRARMHRAAQALLNRSPHVQVRN